MHLQNIEHEFIHCVTLDKQDPFLKLLREVVAKANALKGSVMVFCNSISSCRSLDYFLNDHGFECVSLHGEVPKELRL